MAPGHRSVTGRRKQPVYRPSGQPACRRCHCSRSNTLPLLLLHHLRVGLTCISLSGRKGSRGVKEKGFPKGKTLRGATNTRQAHKVEPDSMKGQKIRPRASGAPARRPLVVVPFGLPTTLCHNSMTRRMPTQKLRRYRVNSPRSLKRFC